MIVRSKEVLEPGLTIFKLGHRFIKSNRLSDEDVICSPWWFSSGTVEVICNTWSGHDSLSDTFRRFGAIAKRWGGAADLIVKAKINKPVVAYIGPGTVQDFRKNPAETKDSKWDMPLWVPSPSIPQIHITLRKDRKDDNGKMIKRTSIGREALTEIYIIPIDKWDNRYILGTPESKWKV
jgi:hypothetical protein